MKKEKVLKKVKKIILISYMRLSRKGSLFTLHISWSHAELMMICSIVIEESLLKMLKSCEDNANILFLVLSASVLHICKKEHSR